MQQRQPVPATNPHYEPVAFSPGNSASPNAPYQGCADGGGSGGAYPGVQPAAGSHGYQGAQDNGIVSPAPYGQNQAYAQRDYQQYQQQQQYQQYPQQQPQPPAGVPYGHGNDVTVIAVLDAPTVPIGLVIGQGIDTYCVSQYSVCSIVAVCILGLICAGNLIALIARFNPFSLAVVIILAIIIAIISWRTTESRLAFDRNCQEMRLERKPLHMFCCTPNAEMRVPFSALQDVGWSGVPGTLGELYIDARDNIHIVFGVRRYYSQQEALLELQSWRHYIASLRGVTVADFARAVGTTFVTTVVAA
jgi:hypothetical protein